MFIFIMKNRSNAILRYKKIQKAGENVKTIFYDFLKMNFKFIHLKVKMHVHT